MKFFENFSYIYERYDSYLVDVYGVLYDGEKIYDGALSLLEQMNKNKRKVVILSNTTLVSERCKERYEKKGMIQGIHYDHFISSGEAFNKTINQILPNIKSYYQIFEKNKDLFSSSNLIETQSIEDADVIYVGTIQEKGNRVRADNRITKKGSKIEIDDFISTDYNDIYGFENIASTLDICIKNNKTLVVANPDIFAMEGILVNGLIEKHPVICPGAIGELYERHGGKVLYFGKPYKAIYDYAKTFLDGYNKTIMIGDTPWTDILGGNLSNFDTALCLSGVLSELSRRLPEDTCILDKYKYVISTIAPKMTHIKMKEFSIDPTYIVKSFA
ncbi:MAG: HAD hydrolase-like protein [Alphaproteobacteria bacterium]|nr:HAD hydrolase-like protein [Alphaproteobacteria bacterium]